MDRFDVGIIGAGASGALVATHLQRDAPALRVAMIEAGARAARGLAYGTPYGAHLLNVPASKMSAFADDPAHFTRWAAERAPLLTGKSFAPRSLYGEYLADVLAHTSSTLVRVSGTAVGLTRHDGWEVHLHDGRSIEARSIVLALGNLPPANPLRAIGNDAYLADPWAPGAAQGLDHDATIVIIGTGLTMIDLVLALRAEGHRGIVHAISRRGLTPQAHAAHLPRSIELPDDDRSPRAMLRWIRQQAAEHDWRSIVDALRPYTARLWQGWSTLERAMFLRHLRVFWDVHRHRIAPEVAEEFGALVAAGHLHLHAGRVQSIVRSGSAVAVEWIDRRTGSRHVLPAARVINCTGPASDYAAIDLPLVVQMRRSGWLVPDPLRLGIETDLDGRVLGRDGEPVAGLFTIGPLRRPALWESTAIPEIREQASQLGRILAALPSSRRRAAAED